MVNHVRPDLVRFLDDNGTPINGAYVWFFLSGTSTPSAPFANELATIPHQNPVLTGQNGYGVGVLPPVYSDGQKYKAVLYDANNVQIAEIDPVPAIPISNSAASGVSFSPYTNFPQTNVQTAIQAVMALWNEVTTYGRGLIATANAAAARAYLGLGDIATRTVASFVQAQSVWNTGTATNEATITPAKLTARINSWNAAREVKSTVFAVGTAPFDKTFAHGLSAAPQEIFAWLVCKEEELGYAVGDHVSIGGSRDGDASRELTMWSDATNIHVTCGGNIVVGTKTSGYTNTVIDPTKWNIYIGARLI